MSRLPGGALLAYLGREPIGVAPQLCPLPGGDSAGVGFGIDAGDEAFQHGARLGIGQARLQAGEAVKDVRAVDLKGSGGVGAGVDRECRSRPFARACSGRA